MNDQDQTKRERQARDIFLRPRSFPGMADSPPVIDSILP